MKIAFLTDTYWPRINGVTVSSDIFVNQLKDRGHEVKLWAPEYGPPGSGAHGHLEPGVERFRSLNVFFSKEDRLPNPRYRKDYYRQLDAFGPDLIHVQTEVNSLFVRTYARSRGIPVVQTCHTYFEQYIAYYFPGFPPRLLKAFTRWLTRQMVKTADALVAPTEAMKAVITSYGITTPVTVVPTGIDVNDFAGLDRVWEKGSSLWLERHPRLRGRKLMLSVGRLAQEKNVDFLLDVITEVKKTEPLALLVMAGSGPYLETFQARIQELGLDDSVLCLGYVDRKELKHLYTLADVFTFASVTETQGLVTIEAMMCGTPVVAIGKMGTREVMQGDHGGFMVDETVGDFTKAVLRLLQYPDLHQSKSDEALAYSRHWTASAMTDRLEALYRSVLSMAVRP